MDILDNNQENTSIFFKRKKEKNVKYQTDNPKKIKVSSDDGPQISKYIDSCLPKRFHTKCDHTEEEVQRIEDIKMTVKLNSFPSAQKRPLNTIKSFKIVSNKNVGPIVPQGNFYALSEDHKKFLFNLRGISKLYDWQEECLSLTAVANRTNLIYSAPTSGGKTLVSEILMLREVLLRKQNVLFLLPYVSIVQEKVHEMMPLAVEFNFLIEEYCAGKGSIPPVKRRKKNSIFICTIEKGQILFDSLIESGRTQEISLIIVDELHMLGDSNRGHILESLLTKVIYLETISIQIIGMSATIANINEISDFLHAEIFVHNSRPIELKEFVKTGNELYKVDTKTKNPSKGLRKINKIVGSSYTSDMLRRDPDHIGYFVYKVVIESSCLVFCATKTNCENVALLIAESLPKDLRSNRIEEKRNLMEAIKSDLNGSICLILLKTIPNGVAYHHSGKRNKKMEFLLNYFI